MTELKREVRKIESFREWLGWHEGPDGDVTASGVAALFGCHPYTSREQLAARLSGESRAGTGMPPDNAAMKRGRRFEPAVAAAIIEEKPEWILTKADTYHRLPEHRLGCTPDYWADLLGRDDGLIQIKTVAPHVWEKWAGRPPLGYLLQTVCELLCTDREWGCLAVMVMGGHFPVYYFDVPRHAEAEQRILAAVGQFWLDLKIGRLGPAASAEGLAELLDDGSVIDLSTDNALPGLLDERELLRQQINIEDKRISEIDALIKEKIGAAARAHLPGWSISYGTHHRKEVTIAAKDIRTLRIRRAREEEEEHAE